MNAKLLSNISTLNSMDKVWSSNEYIFVVVSELFKWFAIFCSRI